MMYSHCDFAYLESTLDELSTGCGDWSGLGKNCSIHQTGMLSMISCSPMCHVQVFMLYYKTKFAS